VPTPPTLGQRIAQARREKGARDHRDITQLDVAKAIGTTGASVSEWEADKKAPREETLSKLARYLGVSPAYLRYGTTETAYMIGHVAADPATIEQISEEEFVVMQRLLARVEAERKAAQPPKPEPKPRRRKNG
jgi:transcriptional regulator with XRE-family HTH domain